MSEFYIIIPHKIFRDFVPFFISIIIFLQIFFFNNNIFILPMPQKNFI